MNKQVLETINIITSIGLAEISKLETQNANQVLEITRQEREIKKLTDQLNQLLEAKADA